jgi:predicted DsbA family dithiol-disulfide isomerase
MEPIEVYADVACPFAHAGLRAFTTFRRQRDLSEPRLVVRAWPLELVNGKPHSGAHLAPEIEALRADAAPDLFEGFDAGSFPTSSLAAMAASAAAYRAGPEQGEVFSLAVRDALWEHGLDIADAEILERLAEQLGVPAATPDDDATVRADWEAGKARGVTGSPHFFTPAGDFFCPSLDIDSGGGEMQVRFDPAGFRRFVETVFD